MDIHLTQTRNRRFHKGASGEYALLSKSHRVDDSKSEEKLPLIRIHAVINIYFGHTTRLPS